MDANQAGDAVTNFYFGQTGRPRNTNAEFSVLRTWQDAIEAELTNGDEPQWYINQLLNMKEQCELFLSELN